MMALRRQLGRVNEVYVGLNDFIILMAWATQPDPVRLCQILGNLMDQIDTLTARLEDLRHQTSRLWDLSYDEHRRRAAGGRASTGPERSLSSSPAD